MSQWLTSGVVCCGRWRQIRCCWKKVVCSWDWLSLILQALEMQLITVNG